MLVGCGAPVLKTECWLDVVHLLLKIECWLDVVPEMGFLEYASSYIVDEDI